MKRRIPGVLATVLAVSGAVLPVVAGTQVLVTVTGFVEYNQITDPPLGNVNVDDGAIMTFTIDSDDFVDNVSFPTRGYAIDPLSFSFTMGSTVMSLQDPFPAGQTPYFVLRDDDPAVDGFFISTDLNGPVGLPIDQAGIFGQFLDNFYVTYVGTTLTSLDILGALGSYDFGGLTVFNWTVDDGPFNPLGLIFEQLTIEILAPPAVPDGLDGPPMLVRKFPLDPSGLRLTFDVTSCSGNAGHHIVYGFGSQLPATPGGTFLVQGGQCAVGGPSYNWLGTPDPSIDPSNLLWFLMLANDGSTTEGPWGQDAADVERQGPATAGSSGECGITSKDLTNSCGL